MNMFSPESYYGSIISALRSIGPFNNWDQTQQNPAAPPDWMQRIDNPAAPPPWTEPAQQQPWTETKGAPEQQIQQMQQQQMPMPPTFNAWNPMTNARPPLPQPALRPFSNEADLFAARPNTNFVTTPPLVPPVQPPTGLPSPTPAAPVAMPAPVTVAPPAAAPTSQPGVIPANIAAQYTLPSTNFAESMQYFLNAGVPMSKIMQHPAAQAYFAQLNSGGAQPAAAATDGRSVQGPNGQWVTLPLPAQPAPVAMGGGAGGPQYA